MNTLYWHDYETFGADAQRDRPVQFAGIRTNEALEIIEQPLVVYCQPSEDSLPHPEACLVTGITPQIAQAKGLAEAEFIDRILQKLSVPGTCSAGYNTIRFDDEVTRNCLYRNFYDPYAREWQNGNSRWDIIDLVRATYSFRPEGIQWPVSEDGNPSFRLEELSKANELEHQSAHDALSDVYATIQMAALIKRHQPKLFDYLYQLRFKNKVAPLINYLDPKPVLHVSGMYPAARACMAMVAPVVKHPSNSNGVIVWDLSVNPQILLDLSEDEIHRRVFTPQLELSNPPEGEAAVERLPLKTVHINKCPVIAPVNSISQDRAAKYGIDFQRCRQHFLCLTQAREIQNKIHRVFSKTEFEPHHDPDLMIYSGGFFGNEDKQAMEQVRNTRPEALHKLEGTFLDARLDEMLFRYRARNYKYTLDPEELEIWHQYCRNKLFDDHPASSISWDTFQNRLAELQKNYVEEPQKLAILQQLYEYSRQLYQALG